MAFPVLAVAGIAIGVGAKILGGLSAGKAAEQRTKALKANALAQLTNTVSGLQAREREELAAARQQERLGRRQSDILEARAIAAGAEGGVGSDEQVQDVQMGEAEFLGSVDANLRMVKADLLRRRKGAQREFQSATKAAEAGERGPEQDFLDFANTAAFALNAFDQVDFG